MSDALFESNLSSLSLLNRGKVRDIYAAGDDHLLIVTSDRLSAFDVILDDPIPGKGRVLTEVAQFWFEQLGEVIPNHISDRPMSDFLTQEEIDSLGGRGMFVKKLKPLPVEAIVRGYIIGSGWKDYQRTGAICGIELPAGLGLADQLPEAIYTPSTKAEVGEHDENISFDQTVALLGADRAAEVRDVSLRLYTEAAKYARERGIIIADTKFEFGLDENDNLVVIDEVLTPDSSRFWPVDEYEPGQNPPSFDKQFVRDWLEASGWDKTPPAPKLPDEIVQKTSEKYLEAQRRLAG